jgi:hypothetical protein
VTLEEFIAATLSEVGKPVRAEDEQSALEALAPFIGAINSSKEAPDPRYRSEFGDLVDEKSENKG